MEYIFDFFVGISLILFVLGVGTVAGAFYLIGRIQARLNDMDKRITKLEEERPKRHTHSVIAGLEDLQANLNDSSFALEVAKIILSQIRNGGPHGYDPDRPASPRYRDMQD